VGNTDIRSVQVTPQVIEEHRKRVDSSHATSNIVRRHKVSPHFKKRTLIKTARPFHISSDAASDCRNTPPVSHVKSHQANINNQPATKPNPLHRSHLTSTQLNSKLDTIGSCRGQSRRGVALRRRGATNQTTVGEFFEIVPSFRSFVCARGSDEPPTDDRRPTTAPTTTTASTTEERVESSRVAHSLTVSEWVSEATRL